MMYRPEYEEKKARKVTKKRFSALPIFVAIGIGVIACIFFAFRGNDTSITKEENIETVQEVISEKEPETHFEEKPLLSQKYFDIFCDDNDLQLAAAKKNGIENVFKLRNDFEHSSPLMEINTCALYRINKLTHSMPYLVPSARMLLDDIAILFNSKLHARYPNADYRIIVTSLLRTEEDIKKLRRRNRNATENSCHRYGTTFDIAYQKYDKIGNITVSESELKHFLAQALYDLRRQERCYVKYERRQRCFHITVRSMGVNFVSAPQCMDIINRYMLAESGNGKYELPKIVTPAKKKSPAKQIAKTKPRKTINHSIKTGDTIIYITNSESSYSDLHAPML